MTLPLSDRLFHLVVESLDDWEEYAGIDKNKRLGEAMQGLIEMTKSYCMVPDWAKAQSCCETACNILESGLEPRGGRMEMDAELSRGAIEFYLASTFIGLNRIDNAITHYRISSDKFASRYAWMAVATIWFVIGKIYSFNAEWDNAIASFQRSLNALDSVSQNLKANGLEKKIKLEFQNAKEGLGQKLFAPAKLGARTNETPEETKLGVRKLFIVKKIAAGDPKLSIDAIIEESLSDDNVIDVLTLDARLFKGAHLGLMVEGDSMIDAGIMSGDYVFLKLLKKAENGEVAVIGITSNGEFETTLKKYFREDMPFIHHHLQPMNQSVPHIVVIPPGSNRGAIEESYARSRIPIMLKYGDAEIVGKVVAVWRKAQN